MKFVYKLENKFGKHYIANLTKIIIIGMAIVYLVNLATPQDNSLISYLTLSRSAILSGQVWRLVTFIFVPVSQSPIWFVIALYLYYSIGQLLENLWGSFKFNLYILFGMLGAIVCMFIIGSSTNQALFFSLFLAYATVAPDNTFYLFMVLPIKAKWLAIVYAVLELYSIFASSQGLVVVLISLGLTLIGLVNYFIFFGSMLVNTIKEKIRIHKNRQNWKNS